MEKSIFSKQENETLDRWQESDIPQLKIRAGELRAIEAMALSGYFGRVSECVKNNDCSSCEHIRNGIWCSFYCMRWECVVGFWELTDEQKAKIKEEKPQVPICRELSTAWRSGCIGHEPEQCLEKGKISDLKQCRKLSR